MSNYSKSRERIGKVDWVHFAIDISLSRVATCQISIFISNFLTEGKQTKFPYWSQFGGDRHFIFGRGRGHSAVLPTSTRNVYAIIATTYTKEILTNVSLSGKLYVQTIINFGIAFNLGNGYYELCTQRAGGRAEISEMNCNQHGVNVVTRFQDLQTIQTKWEIFGIDNIDIVIPKGAKKQIDFMSHPKFINPFDRIANYPIHQHIAQIVFRKINGTLAYCTCLLRGHSNIKLGHFTQYDYGDSIKVPLEFTGYKFLSCYSETAISFQFYVAPFKRDVWICLMASILLVIGMLSCYVKFMWDGSSTTSFCAWLTVTATIFEEPILITNKIGKSDFFRLVFVTWALVCVLLTNCYNGLMISALNAPLAGWKPESFTDLVCGGMNTNNATEELFVRDRGVLYWYAEKIMSAIFGSKRLPKPPPGNQTFPSPECFKLLSAPEESHFLGTRMYDFVSFLASSYSSFLNRDIFKSVKLVPSPLLYNLLHPKHAHHPDKVKGNDSLEKIRRVIEMDVVKCGKSVYVAEISEIAAQLDFLSRNYFWLKFHTGKDLLNPHYTGWIIKREGISKVSTYYRLLIDSGIYERLNAEVIKRKFANRQPVVKWINPKTRQAIGMNRGIATLYILCGCIFGVALLCFVLERKAMFIFFILRVI
ncbi:hypothetical protein Fcan01_04722 [Folsomia candida]|uniref:Uncharacterized protein n=1 Tax=Folsomia candida TaxID=158441 RepID=A0A226EP94_FOLCA|nr:hypothetical protein Fcan01_04722 [Folsomia candida]